MNRSFSHICLILTAIFMMVCLSEEVNAMPSTENNNTDIGGKLLIGYNAYTNNTTSTMNLQVNSHVLIVDLVSNSSTEALLALLKEAPITYEAHDYGNFEKVGDIGHTLPQNNEQITTEPGDIILYQGNNICIYYDANSWNFTRLGKIRNVSQNELKNILGSGNVTVTLSLDDATSVKTAKTTDTNSQQIYAIDGQQLKQVPSKGIYIENGVKKIRQ